MTRSDFWTIMLLQWGLFAFILLCAVLYMDTRNLQKELGYMKHFESSISSGALQDIMCNGSPV